MTYSSVRMKQVRAAEDAIEEMQADIDNGDAEPINDTDVDIPAMTRMVAKLLNQHTRAIEIGQINMGNISKEMLHVMLNLTGISTARGTPAKPNTPPLDAKAELQEALEAAEKQEKQPKTEEEK